MLAYLFCFCFMPMGGIVIAFKDFKYPKGIFGSSWVGIKHFKYFFESRDAFKVIGNTIGYGISFYIIGAIAAIFVALLLYEIKSRRALKVYQTAYTLPNFISWVLVAYIGYTLLSSDFGVINQALRMFGLEPVKWYSEPKYWGIILAIFSVWQSVGMNSIIYYAALMGVDESLIEAAKLDGANYRQRVRYVLFPSVLPVVSVLSILAVGTVMNGNFGLFYQVPMDSGALYSATDIIQTYVVRGLIAGNISQTAAVGLFQSAVGLVLVVAANLTVRKINPENAMF